MAPSFPTVTSDNVRAFGLRDTVRLLNRHDAIPAGTVGSVIGWFVGDARVRASGSVRW